MWNSGEYITSMVEHRAANEEPHMLVGTSSGRIFKYPYGTDDNGNDFPAHWRGVFGTERAAYSQKLEKVEVHTGDKCKAKVRWSVRPKRESGDTPTRDEGYLALDNAVNTCNIREKTDGRFWEIQIDSPPVASGETATTWTVNDIVLQVARLS